VLCIGNGNAYWHVPESRTPELRATSPVTAGAGAPHLDGMSMDAEKMADVQLGLASVAESPEGIASTEDPSWDSRLDTSSWAPLMEEASPPPSTLPRQHH